MLDELGAMGTLVWVGLGALGPGDGKVALFRRDRVAKLVDPPQLPDDVSPLARALHELLARRGACFFTEIDAAMKAEGVTTRDEILVAVWDLVWAGLLTNDTFQPLCSLSMRKPTSSGRRRGSDMRTAGRWSLVAQLVGDGVSPTERAHARALMLLERHGIVSRDAAAMEALVGGFSGVYPVLRSMEEAGKLRRGYFVDGIGGAQFAFAGAVDRLRAMRGAREPEVTLLSAADPANAYGWILPWPEPTSSESRQPKRHAGAWLVLVDGVAVAYFDRGAALITFAEADRAQLERGLSALAQRLAERSKKAVRIDEIDGLPALRSPLASLLKELGLTFDHRGMIIERKV
jgi:ATP-dependent Lhr-like helicase